MKDKGKEARELLRTIFGGQPRANGKTFAMIEGLKNATRPVVCLVHSQHFAKQIKSEIKNKNVTFITPREMLDLRGRRDLIVADHVVIEELLRQAFEAPHPNSDAGGFYE